MKKRRYLDFERPLQDLDEEIERMRGLSRPTLELSEEVLALERKSEKILQSITSSLTPYQIVQLARHPERPTTLDFISYLTEDFVELVGDRAFAEDRSIVGGLARFDQKTIMIIGHQKGKSTAENQIRNFGMPRPEGYRKALRLLKLAEQWRIPVVTWIDTPGAYPGIDAEERGQAEAIARNILEMAGLRQPIISVVIGEGGSGGALALGVNDYLLMFQYSIYSVISPEGCAAITWKDASAAAQAAKALKLTAQDAFDNGICDQIIAEPLGGAHRDFISAAQALRTPLIEACDRLMKLKESELMKRRYMRLRAMGAPDLGSVPSVDRLGMQS